MMEYEYETTANVGGEIVPVLLVWEADGYKPLGVDVYIGAEYDELTEVSPEEEDRLYAIACEVTVGRMADMGEFYHDLAMDR